MRFAPKPGANPFGALIRTSERIGTDKARMPMALAETPPRDGPFAPSAADVTSTKPPRTRSKRQSKGGVPWAAGPAAGRVFNSRYPKEK